MGQPTSALAAARHMCERSSWSLTNLALQKIMYLAQMFYLGKHDERLFNGSFEAWDFGPVVPQVYHNVKQFGGGPIEFLFSPSRVSDDDRIEMLNDACDQLSQRTAGELVNITHWSKGAWAKHYRPGLKGIIIPDADIKREYLDRAAAHKS